MGGKVGGIMKMQKIAMYVKVGYALCVCVCAYVCGEVCVCVHECLKLWLDVLSKRACLRLKENNMSSKKLALSRHMVASRKP